MNRKGGQRRKSRSKLTRDNNQKRKIPIRKILQTFKIGDNVQFIADSNMQNGMFHLRFNSKRGVIKAKKGRAYLVEIKDGSKKKIFMVQPIHLKKIKVETK